jgi:hypothetical protein
VLVGVVTDPGRSRVGDGFDVYRVERVHQGGGHADVVE